MWVGWHPSSRARVVPCMQQLYPQYQVKAGVSHLCSRTCDVLGSWTAACSTSHAHGMQWYKPSVACWPHFTACWNAAAPAICYIQILLVLLLQVTTSRLNINFYVHSKPDFERSHPQGSTARYRLERQVRLCERLTG